LNARDRAVVSWLEDADRKRLTGSEPALAKALYARVLALDPGNSKARAGLMELERDERVIELMDRAQNEAKQGQLDLALSRLRAVLAEHPRHGAALSLREKILGQKAQPRVAMDAKLAAAYRRPISLEFRDAQLKQVFEVLSRTSGLNFVLDKEVRGDQRTTLFLRSTTVADALAMALLTNQLEQRILDGNTILVYPNTQAKLKEYQLLNVKSFVLASADAKVVANNIKSILKARDLVVDEKQNMIVMRDSPEAIQIAEKIVELQDQPEAEVMLDVEVLEVKHSRLIQAGVQYPSQVTFAPLTRTTGAPLVVEDLKGLAMDRISINALNVGIQAKETDSTVNVLANPRIRSRSREKAKIQVGERVPNITSTSTATGFLAESVQYVDVGLKLEVEPIVSPDGEVTIKMGLEVSSILQQIQTKAGSIAYEIGTRNASTVLRLRDGENQILAGLINDEDRRGSVGVPGLSRLPLVGRKLFGSSNDDSQKSEIVLSITPRIVRPAFRPDPLLSEFESGTEANLKSRVLEPAFTTVLAAPLGQASLPASSLLNEARGSSRRTASEQLGPAKQVGALPAPGGVGNAPPKTSIVAEASVVATPENQAPDVLEPSGGILQSKLELRGNSSVPMDGLVTVELWARSSQALATVPLTLHYDPEVLSLAQVEQGDFMSNAKMSASLSKRIDAAAGVVRVVVSTSGATGRAAEGVLLRFVFKPLKPSESVQIGIQESVVATTVSSTPQTFVAPEGLIVKVR